MARMSTGEDQTRYYVPATLHRALDLLPMLQAVSTGLDLLQPWISTDKRDFPAKVLPFVDKVRKQSVKYHEALAVSADVAQHGFNWTLDMERYCAVLKRGSGGNELLNGYIKLMRAGAKDAQRQSKALSDQFVRVSAALHHIAIHAGREADASAQNITTSAAQIEENTQKWDEARNRIDNIINTCDALAWASLAVSAACGAPAFIATATAAAAGYGLGVLIGGVDHHLNDNRMQLAFARQVGFKEENSPHASAVLAKKALTEVEVIRYLAAVVGGIELIVKYVDIVAKWWNDMDSELEGIQATGLARLEGQHLAQSSNRSRRLGRRWPFRRTGANKQDGADAMDPALIHHTISMVQDSIKQRKNDFKEYKNQVQALRARNPPPRY